MKDLRKNLLSITPEKIRKFLRWIRMKMFLLNAIESKIVDHDEVGEKVFIVKNEGIEPIRLAKMYNFISSGKIDINIPKIEMMKYRDALIFPYSDFVICEKGTVWEKFYRPQFSKIIPIDFDLIKRKDKRIFIRKPQIVKNVKIGFSICGVHSWAWTHFIVQYLPKIFLIRDVLKMIDQKMTIILPEYSDKQLHDLVYHYLGEIDGIEVLHLKKREAAFCETLYHVDNIAWLSEFVKDVSSIDGVVPKFVATSIKSNLGSLIQVANLNVKKIANKKLFIARERVRNLNNYKEIEDLFIDRGYIVILPHTFSLYEKIRIFQNASHVVGPVSGGFTNLFLCKPGTKVLMFNTYQRCLDSYNGFFVDNFGLDMTMIVGADNNQNDINSSFDIPLSIIQTACEELGF